MEFSLVFLASLSLFGLAGELFRLSLIDQTLAEVTHESAQAVSSLPDGDVECEETIQRVFDRNVGSRWLFDRNGNDSVDIVFSYSDSDAWPSVTLGDEIAITISWTTTPKPVSTGPTRTAGSSVATAVGSGYAHSLPSNPGSARSGRSGRDVSATRELGPKQPNVLEHEARLVPVCHVDGAVRQPSSSSYSCRSSLCCRLRYGICASLQPTALTSRARFSSSPNSSPTAGFGPVTRQWKT